MERFLSVIGRLVVGHRRVTLGVVALLVLGMGYAALDLEADFTPEDLFAVDPAARDTETRFNDLFPTQDNAVLVLVEAEDVVSLPVLEYVHRLSQELGEIARVERVESITASAFARTSEETGELSIRPVVEGAHVESNELEAVRELVAQSSLVERRVLGATHRVALVALLLESSVDRIDEMEDVLVDVESGLAALPPPEGVTLRLSGLPHVRVEVVRTLWEDQLRLVPLALLVGLVLMWISIRWSAAPLLATISVAAAGVITLGYLALSGGHIDVINQAIPILLVIVASSECVHISMRYLEETRLNGPGPGAAKGTMRHMAVACLLTTLTNAVGFLALTASHGPLMPRFGMLAAAGIMTSYLVSMTLLPAALSYTRPRVRVIDEQSGWLVRITEGSFRLALRRPWVTTSVAAVVVGSAVWLSASLPVDTSLTSYFPDDHPIVVTNGLVEDELSGAFPAELLLSSPEEGRFDEPDVLNAISGLLDWAPEQEGVLAATAYPTQLREAWVAFTRDVSKRDEPFRTRAQVANLASLLEGVTPNPIAPYVTPDRRHARVMVQVRDVGATAGLQIAESLRREAANRLAAFDDIRVEITGRGVVFASGLDTVAHDLLKSFSFAFVAIFLSITLLFRSLRVGLLSMWPNVAPNFLVTGYMVLRDIPLDMNNAVVFAIGTGLAVEDTVHVFARVREELRAGATVDEALVRAARGAGRGILLASIMLVAGFAVLATSNLLVLRRFGELLAVIALTAALFDLTATPALIKLGYRQRALQTKAGTLGAPAIVEPSEG